jgi:hypothetical protein
MSVLKYKDPTTGVWTPVGTGGGGGGSYTDEQVRDVVTAMLQAGSNVTLTPNDPSDTLTIAAVGGGTDEVWVGPSAPSDPDIELWYDADAVPPEPPAGPAGPIGPTGEKGDPGEPGGALLSAFWTYASTTTAPPSNGQMRTDSPITTLWVAETDTDGMVRTAGLATAEVGDTLIVRAANGTSMDLLITGPPVDSGTYFTIPVSVISGTVTKGARTMIGILSPTSPFRHTLNAQTGTTYAPVIGDENKMVTLSNAGAITVSLPQNAAAAFPIGAEVDFLWLGVGQPTFAAGVGATVNATPGLKLRARYSAATAKKISTNGWVVIGDLSP